VTRSNRPPIDRPLRVLLICAIALTLSWVIGKTGALKKFEHKLQDVWAVWAPRDDKSMDHIVLVRITEREYRDERLFNGRRPLNPAALQRTIEAIAAHEPLLIGVDIDTSDPDFKSLEELNLRSPVPIVWAEDTRDSAGRLEAVPVLGGNQVETQPDARMGLGLITADSQGMIRTYQRSFETTEGPRPSFVCALIDQCGATRACRHLVAAQVVESCHNSADGSHDDRLIDYRRQFETKSPSPFFTADEVLQAVTLEKADRDRWKASFHDKIVLLGGTFPASGDAAHATPLGLRPGVEIMGHILGTELRGGGAHSSRPYATALIVVFETYLIVFLMHRRRVFIKVMAGTAMVLVLAVLSSLLTEYHVRRTPYYIVVLACVLALQACVAYIKYSQAVFVDACEDLVRRFQTARRRFTHVALREPPPAGRRHRRAKTPDAS